FFLFFFFFSSRRRHTRSYGDWSSDVCSSDLQHQLAVDFCESGVRGIVTSLALAGLVVVHSSRHEISPAIRAGDEGPDLIARSDAVEVVIRRDAEDAEQLGWRCVLHARQSGGFRSLPPCVDGVDGR